MNWSEMAQTLAVSILPLVLMFGLSGVSDSIRRVADEMKADREERKRQFDLERQYPGAP